MCSLRPQPGFPGAEQRGCTKLLGSEGLLPAWFLFPSPPISIHLPREVEAAADIGAGAVSYVNGCVQVQSPDPRRGASSSAKSQRAPTPLPIPYGRLRGAASSQPCAGNKGCCPAECWGHDSPPPALGVLPPALLPLGLGCWGEGGGVLLSCCGAVGRFGSRGDNVGRPALPGSFLSRVSRGSRLSRPRGDESPGLGSGSPFDYKFIAGLILSVGM